ncbi:MAG: ROK family protein [Kiritimatiellia bacterium]|jgi:glucokinase
MKLHLGIDIGGTNVVAGIVAEDGRILRKESFATRAPRDAASLCDDMADACRRLASAEGAPLAAFRKIGVGCPGLLSGGTVNLATNLGFRNVPLASLLTERTGLPTFVLNDANAAAYGELVAGCGRGASSLVAVTIGTGIGGGIMIRRRIYEGFNGQGAEVGHMVVEPDGRPCSCGYRGCFEAYCSATALVRDTREAMALHLDSAMWELCGGDLRKVDGRTAFEGMRRGDDAARAVVDSFIQHLSRGISNLVILLQPEVLCIGGSISAEGETLLAPLRELVARRTLFTEGDKATRIVAAELAGDAGLIGAALAPAFSETNDAATPHPDGDGSGEPGHPPIRLGETDALVSGVLVDGRTCDIHVSNGVILSIVPSAGPSCGLAAIPGLVDIHIHGAGGNDAMDADFAPLSRFLASQGTTSWMPTTMTASPEALRRVAGASWDVPGARIVGLHLEGPFLSPARAGAQDAAFLRKPDLDEVRSLPGVKLVTVAPETEGALDFIRSLSGEAAVAIGHTDCDYDLACRAFDAGATQLAHIWNVMPPLLHRAPGPIGAALVKDASVQLIADGVHVHPAVVLATWRMFGPGRVALVSDSIRPGGLADGDYVCGGLPVRLEHGVARLRDGGALAGGSLTLWQCVRQAVSFGIPFDDAVRMATRTPANLIGRSDLGRLAPGATADFLLVDRERMELRAVYIGGVPWGKE